MEQYLIFWIVPYWSKEKYIFIEHFSHFTCLPSLQPGSKMVTSAKSSVPTVTDQAAAMQLGQCAKNLATCLAELRTSAQKVLILGGTEEIYMQWQVRY